MDILAGKKTPTARTTAAKSKAKALKATPDVKAKASPKSKTMAAKRPAAKKPAAQVKPKAKPKASLKMTRKDVYSRAYHKAKLEVVGDVTDAQAADYARCKAREALRNAGLPP